MASNLEQPKSQRGRKVWLRIILVSLNLILAGSALWLGMSIPSYFRSVSPLVLEAAAADTPKLEQLAWEETQAGRPGRAQLLLQSARMASSREAFPEVNGAIEELWQEHPAYRWSGGPAPFYEQFLNQAQFLREDESAVIPTLLPAQHRQALLGFLQQSANRNVHRILGARELGGWQRFYPVYSTSGHPLDATLLAVALMEQASALPEGIRRPLLNHLDGAFAEDPEAMNKLESLLVGVLTLGRYANWTQLTTMMSHFEEGNHLLFAAQALQEDEAHLPVLFSALLLTSDTDRVVDYLFRTGNRGWDGLVFAMGMGRGAAETLVQFNRPVYQPPKFWYALPEELRNSQRYFKEFAESFPDSAIAARALAFAMCGFFLVYVLRILILGPRPVGEGPRRLLINLDSLVGGVLVMMLVWVLIEPGLLDFRPNEEGKLQIKLAQIMPESPISSTESITKMIDQATILVLLLFLVLQLLVFIFGLLKLAEIRKQAVNNELKLRLIENEENLFDLGLYIGLGGTVASLILVVLNVVDASLMAAYASTLFGIIFVAILKVGFVRPFRRRLILEKK